MTILDACRDNLFQRVMPKTVANRSVGRGLARIEPHPRGLCGKSRSGGLRRRGRAGQRPFAAALIRNMRKPGVEIRKFFGLVRDDVTAATSNAQEPFVYGSLSGDDYFLRKP